MHAAQTNADAKHRLEASLRRVALTLWARQWLGALPMVLCVLSAGVIAALLLLVLAPRLLFGGALVAAPTALGFGACLGLAGGLALAASRVRRPTVSETALALESRLAGRDASLSTLLETSGDFQAILVDRASAELRAALAAPAPHTLSTRALIVVPLWLLGAAVCAAVAWGGPVAGVESLGGPGPQARSGSLDAVNVATDRGQADASALAQAQGMKQAAGKLEQAASALQQVNADRAGQQAALDDARTQVDNLPATDRPAQELPAQLPVGEAAKSKLALEMMAAAGALRAAAERKAAARADGQAAGQGNAQPEPASRPQFVPFPAPANVELNAGAAAELAAQTPARRQLVQRALAATR